MILSTPTYNNQRSSLLFPNVGRENESTQLKNLFLNNIESLDEKNRWHVTQLKSYRLIIYVLEEQVNVLPCGKCFSELVLAV